MRRALPAMVRRGKGERVSFPFASSEVEMPIGVHDLGVSRLRSTRKGFGGSYFFKWLPSQSNTVRCHWELFEPFSTPWLSSGKTRSCAGKIGRGSGRERGCKYV